MLISQKNLPKKCSSFNLISWTDGQKNIAKKPAYKKINIVQWIDMKKLFIH